LLNKRYAGREEIYYMKYMKRLSSNTYVDNMKNLEYVSLHTTGRT